MGQLLRKLQDLLQNENEKELQQSSMNLQEVNVQGGLIPITIN